VLALFIQADVSKTPLHGPRKISHIQV